MCTMSCSLLDDTQEYPFVFDSNGVPAVVGQGINFEAYVNQVCGSGWSHESTFKILEDGKLEKKDFWETRNGGGPASFYFDRESITAFLAEFSAGFFFSTQPLEFKDSAIWLDSYPKLRILSVEKDQMVCIELLPAVEWGKVYGLSTYRRMTASELADKRDLHSKDKSDSCLRF